MPRNQKLTKVIAGRTIKAATIEPGGVSVLFDDGSNMKIKTSGPATIPPGGKVKAAHEAKAEFKINFEDGSSATLSLADPVNAVKIFGTLLLTQLLPLCAGLACGKEEFMRAWD